MIFASKSLLALTVLLPLCWFGSSEVSILDAAGQLKLPADYRQWVFLGSGLNMTYGPAAGMATTTHPMFDNVYVNPDSYKAFLDTGKWPDRTVLILEVRFSESHASINKEGHFQTGVAAIEAHVKLGNTWTFYAFSRGATTASAIPRNAGCYTCHSANGAVENTFVQFYPDLYNVALAKGTLAPSFKPLPLDTGQLRDLALSKPWSQTKAALDTLVVESPTARAITANALNSIAYELMSQNKPEIAAQFLLWASARNPTQANLVDSLADAYLASNDTAAALEATRRALSMLDADNSISPNRRKLIRESAGERLKKIEALTKN